METSWVVRVGFSLLLALSGWVALAQGDESSEGAESAADEVEQGRFPVQPEGSGAGGVVSVSEATPPASNRAGALSVAPMSLMEQRLHESSFPAEAEFRCFLASTCALGLSRGFTLGGDLGAMLGTPVFGPIIEPGRWLVFDGFAGFQFLRAVDEDVYFNAGIGYRTLEYKDSGDRLAETAGMTFNVAYGQRILGLYSQGVILNGFYANNRVEDVGEGFGRQNSDERDFIEKFYHFTQSYPRFRLGFPADFEFINWKNSHIDLPNHLRGYGRVEPFFIQNEFKESFEDFGEYHFTERNYGLRLSYLMSYVSPQERFGRLGLLAGIGLDIQATDDDVSYPNQASDYRIELPTRKTFGFYWELGGSFQF